MKNYPRAEVLHYSWPLFVPDGLKNDANMKFRRQLIYSCPRFIGSYHPKMAISCFIQQSFYTIHIGVWSLPKKVSTDQKLKVFSGLVPYFGGWWIRKRPDPEIWSLLLISLSILDNLLKKENYFCENLGNSFIYALDLLAQSTPRWTFPALYQNSHALIILSLIHISEPTRPY